MRNFLVCKRHFLWVTLGVLTALFLVTTSPLMAAVTTPVGPPVPPALSSEAIAALTPAQKIARAEALSAAALFMATKALKTGDLALAREAQDLINQASALDCNVSRHSAGTQNAKLAQAALNTASRIIKTLDLLLAVAENIAASSTDAKKVAAAKAFQVKATNAQRDILVCHKIALAAGARMTAIEAYEPNPRPSFTMGDSFDRKSGSPT